MIYPAVRRHPYSISGIAVPLLAISLLIQPADATASQRARRPRSAAAVAPAEDATLITGAVESASPGVIHTRGRRFDVSRARFVGPDGKPSSASFVRHGIKVSLTLDGGRVVEVRIYPPMARE
jgi:hypothetical protein